jgi:hypothetical protein
VKGLIGTGEIWGKGSGPPFVECFLKTVKAELVLCKVLFMSPIDTIPGFEVVCSHRGDIFAIILVLNLDGHPPAKESIPLRDWILELEQGISPTLAHDTRPFRHI